MSLNMVVKGRALTVNIVNLCWPEEEQDKIVAATKEGDEKDHNHCLLCLAEECSRHHWVWRVEFPYEEDDDENNAKDEWCQVMGTSPWILCFISTFMR